MKLIVLLSVIALTVGAKIKTQQNPITQQNTDLFKYSPNDIYSLPEDIDDDSDKPPVIYHGDSKTAKVTQLENINSGRGKFKVSLKTENGIELNQAGKLKDEKTFVISGSYTYTGADGKRYRVRYTADELGYHPITELDVEIPEPKEPSAASSNLNGSANKLNGLGDKYNGFQFLKRPIGGENTGAFGNHGASSNTVVHQKGQGYSFESSSSGATFGGLTAPGYGGFGSASVQRPVVNGGSSTLTSLGHGSQSTGNAGQGSASFGSVVSQTSSGPHTVSTFGSVSKGSNGLSSSSGSSSTSFGAGPAHGSSSFGSSVSQGSSGSGSTSFGAGPAHGSSSFGSSVSQGSPGSSSASFGAGPAHGSHGSSSFGSSVSQGSLGSGSASFGAGPAHGSSSFGSSVSQGSSGSGSTSFGAGPAHGASFSSVSKGPQTVSTFGSVSKGPQTVSTFGSVSKAPQTVSTFGSVSNGPQTASHFASVSKGPQGGSGVSVSGGSFAGNGGNGNSGSFSSGHVSVSAGSAHGSDKKTAASHNVDVFSQIEHHGEDGYNYVPPTNQYLPPASQTVSHQPHSEATYLPPLKK